MTELDMILSNHSRAPRWQTMETIDVAVLDARRRAWSIAQRLMAVALAVVMIACALHLGASRPRTAAFHGIPAAPALQVTLQPPPGT